MREGLFLKKNIDKWKQYQYEAASNPDEMAQQFTELVNDLGMPKPFTPTARLPNTSTGWLQRSISAFTRINREESSRFARFWKTELPLTVRKYHRELLYAFLIFTCPGCNGCLFRCT